MLQWKSMWLWIAVCLFIFIFGQDLNAQTASEYQIKAVYLEKVARFIIWPESNAPDDTIFRICVAGNNPFNNILDESYQDRKIKGKSVIINYATEPSDVDNCQLLFIGSNCENALNQYLEKANKNNILVFSDIQGYASKGVHINFYPQEDRIFFEINLSALRNAGLDASSYLLDYARIVKTKKE